MKRTVFIVLLSLVIITLSWSDPDFSIILADLDNLGNFDDTDYSAVYTIVSEKPGEDQSIIQARLFRRDNKEQFVLLILKPEVQKGQGYLQVEDSIWFYDPESRKFERSTLRENIQGSDAQNEDFNRNSLSEDYEIVNWSEGTLGSFPVYILELEAISRDVAYEKVKIWVRKDRNILLKQEDYSVNGRLLRTSLIPNYLSVGGKYIPSRILIIDALNEGERTQITVSEPSIAIIPDYVFSKAYLERVNN
ncbi:MAG: outer membrane lipoprotein-sorting protein [Spirochaetales bacterium]|nr:outer membrane lipoprotein-sorting protein [Spirochaetales bacterium]